MDLNENYVTLYYFSLDVRELKEKIQGIIINVKCNVTCVSTKENKTSEHQKVGRNKNKKSTLPGLNFS